MHLINRTAIDSSGRVGSLYDGYRDRVLGSLNINHPAISCQLRETRRCEIVCGNKDLNQNILQIARIDDQSRLSIILNLTEKTSVSVMVDYSYPINQYTRLFCYTYVEREQKLSDDPKDIQKITDRSTSQTKATHIITGVEWGIDVVVILQLPSIAETVTEIDRVLQRVCTFLCCDYNTLPLSHDEKIILKRIVHTMIYSNTDELKCMRTLYDVCVYIEKNKNSTVDQPILYNLRPITWLYPEYTGEGTVFVPLPTELSYSVEQYVVPITMEMKKLAAFASEDVPKLLSGHLQEELFKVQKQYLDVKGKCTDKVQRFSKLVLEVRNSQIKMSQIDDALKDNEQITMRNTIFNLNQILCGLAEKGHFIQALNRENFRYVNVADHGIDRTHTGTTIERKLIKNDQHDRIICSTDALNKNDLGRLRQFRCDLLEELKNDSNLHLIYADFSYCSYQLQYIMRLPLSKYNVQNNMVKSIETSSSKEIQYSTTPSTKTQISVPTSTKVQFTGTLSTNTQTNTLLPTKSQTFFPTATEMQTSIPATTNIQITDSLSTKAQNYPPTQAKPRPSLPLFTKVQTPVSAPTKSQTYVPRPTEIHTPRSTSSSIPDNEIINFLLLGETGVGKSTFINALANYLTFNTLQQAETGQPVVLISVSFLITVGHNFDEYTVKFGDLDGLKNEDFEHPGQSVTQRCKSHDFRLNDNDRKILRIIDTPGFGDTRGINQDDRNMEHILQYIKTLSHLNAICFLLKPNESRLNIFFRSCLTQLCSLLGRNMGSRIIFCFTNSRSTFYTPGNTAPLLKKMLASLSMDDIPFKKDNTFCFDSESFRYLVALQNKIPFNELEKREYETSWTKSVTDANRLIRYIRTNLTAYPILNK